MAKAAKKKATTKRGRYEEKVVVNATFSQVIQVAIEDANKKSAPKKTP